MLDHYQQRFDTVELNNTFYRQLPPQWEVNAAVGVRAAQSDVSLGGVYSIPRRHNAAFCIFEVAADFNFDSDQATGQALQKRIASRSKNSKTGKFSRNPQIEIEEGKLSTLAGRSCFGGACFSLRFPSAARQVSDTCAPAE